MKSIVTQLQEDGTRKKGIVDGLYEKPEIKSNQVLLETVYSGVTNGSERNDLTRGNYARADSDLPAGWGYQNVGKVVEVGGEFEGLAKGDFVYSSNDHMEYCVIEPNHLFVKLPVEVDLKDAALFGMASVAMRTCRNADLRMGDEVLIVGAGFIGQTAAQIANVMGSRVTLCDINKQRLDLAEKIGACERIVNVFQGGLAGNIEEYFDKVLDLAGVVGMETELIQRAKPKGSVSFIAGRFKVEYEFNIGQGHEITIKQNSHFDNDDLANLCRLVAKGQVKIGPFIKDVVSIEKAYEIYDTLRDEPGKLFGTVFDWGKQ